MTSTRRVEEIGYRLAQANPDLCRHARPLLGMTLHDLSSYSVADRSRARAMYGLEQGVAIARVIPGGPASDAGLTAGDVILASGTISLAAYRPDLVTTTASYDRITAIEELFATQIESGTPQLTVRSPDGVLRIVKLPDRRGCVSRFVVVQERKPNAWSDEKSVAVTSGLVALLASDDALAFVLAHEMAHVIACHACQQKSRMLAKLGFGSKNWRAAELSADAMALKLLQAAQFSPEGAFGLLLTLDEVGYGRQTGTHPEVRARIEALRALMPDKAQPRGPEYAN